MDPLRRSVWGHASSSQGLDGASSLLHELSIVPRGVTPISLARQSNFPQIVQSMREMEEKHDYAQRRRFQLPLKTAFIKAFHSLELPEPEFRIEQRNNCFQFTITMMLDSESTDVVGELCGTFEAVKKSAIRNALDKIVTVENVLLINISIRKAKDLIRAGREIYFKTLSAFAQVHSMLQKQIECIENISYPLDFARELLKGVNEVDKQTVDGVLNHLLLIRGGCTIQITELDAMMKALSHEKLKYVVAARAQPFPNVPSKKVEVDDVEALDFLVQSFGLPECHYSANIGDNDRYLGGIQFTFSSGESENPHTVMIFAKDHKRTIAKAHNATAREGIYYLEGRFKLDVASYNHQRAIVADQENFVWKGLKEEIMVFGESVLRTWKETLKKLHHCIKEHKKPAIMGNDIDGLFQRLDVAAAKCDQSLKVIVKHFLFVLYLKKCQLLCCS